MSGFLALEEEDGILAPGQLGDLPGLQQASIARFGSQYQFSCYSQMKQASLEAPSALSLDTPVLEYTIEHTLLEATVYDIAP